MYVFMGKILELIYMYFVFYNAVLRDFFFFLVRVDLHLVIMYVSILSYESGCNDGFFLNLVFFSEVGGGWVGRDNALFVQFRVLLLFFVFFIVVVVSFLFLLLVSMLYEV